MFVLEEESQKHDWSVKGLSLFRHEVRREKKSEVEEREREEREGGGEEGIGRGIHITHSHNCGKERLQMQCWIENGGRKEG